MDDLLGRLGHWWQAGDLLMPVMLAVALVLYALLAERTLVLWGVRRRHRAGELAGLLHGRFGQERVWASRYVRIAEEEQLTGGFAVIRALTASLPLLGLLGTVTGMVGTFDGLAAAGPGTAVRHASAGVSLSLTATQYGMAMAVPAALWDWILARRVAQLVLHRELLMRTAPDDGDGR